MTSWNRRVAAATRFREGDPDSMEERFASLGLPHGLHHDDAIAIAALVRVAEHRAAGFGTTVLARVTEDDGSKRTVRIVILGNESGVTTLVGDAEHHMILDPLTGLPGRDYLLEMLDLALKEPEIGANSVALSAAQCW